MFDFGVQRSGFWTVCACVRARCVGQASVPSPPLRRWGRWGKMQNLTTFLSIFPHCGKRRCLQFGTPLIVNENGIKNKKNSHACDLAHATLIAPSPQDFLGPRVAKGNDVPFNSSEIHFHHTANSPYDNSSLSKLPKISKKFG